MSRALKFVFIWHRSEANALGSSGRTAQSKLKFIRARFEPIQSRVPAQCRDMTCDAFPPRRGRPPAPKNAVDPKLEFRHDPRPYRPLSERVGSRTVDLVCEALVVRSDARFKLTVQESHSSNLPPERCRSDPAKPARAAVGRSPAWASRHTLCVVGLASRRVSSCKSCSP